MKKVLFTLGIKILFIFKTLMLTMAKIFPSIGKKLFLFVKELFIKLFNIIFYNPIIRKVSAFTFLTAFITGSIFLVFFAIVSPELPPDNLFSSLKDIAEYQGFHDFSRADVVLSPYDDDWVKLTAFDDSDFETGAGSPTQDRSKDFEYPVRPGETLSEIAFTYDIPYDFLAWYNKITNADRIRFGTILIIPSLENIQNNEREYQSQRARQRQAVIAAKTPKNIEVTYASRSSGAGSGVTVNFSVVNPPPNLRSFEWDLGDGKRSFHENPSHEYTAPRTYTIRLTAQDNSGIIYKSNHLYIDIPYPASIAEHSTIKFVTLSSPDEHFVVSGKIKSVSRHVNMEDVLDLSESDKYLTKVKFKTPGYFGITVLESGNKEQYYSVFVSPIPTMHVDNVANNSNWYRTQFNTGTPSNCGPATTAMGISWATGKYFPVSAVRQAVGWHGDGGTSFDELLNVIKNHGINASFQSLKTAQDIRDVIDSGSIAIILFLTSGVKMSKQNPANDLFGRYYTDSVGHYVVVKGYSLNGDYFVIHDPIPSDWSGNSFRYADEISMIGRNRYFPVTEVLKSLRRNEMIIVPGQK